MYVDVYMLIDVVYVSGCVYVRFLVEIKDSGGPGVRATARTCTK